MKKIFAMAAVAALAAGASAYAANPFADVSTSDWAFQAISDLSDRGMIEGYPDGTFKGQQNITRFEVAQIIARLMAKEDQMNAEDRAIVNRLASEYGAELKNLGVRVDNLEKKVGQISWSGDARIRYTKATRGGNIEDIYTGAHSGTSDDIFDARIRIDAHAQVNDTTYVHGRLAVANSEYPTEGYGADLKNGGSANVRMDRLYVHHQFGKVGATLGRYELDMGQQGGGWLYAKAFDGLELAAPLGEKVDLSVGYGRLSGAAQKTMFSEYNGTVVSSDYNFSKAETVYVQLKADLRVAKLGLDYLKVSPYGFTASSAPYNGTGADFKKSVWGVNLLVPIKDFRVFGDYYANTQNYGNRDEKGKIWTVGLGYGQMDLNKPGSFALDLAYFKVKPGLYEYGMSGLETQTIEGLLSNRGRFWLVTADVALAKNTYLHGEYAFAAKGDWGDMDAMHVDPCGNSWALSLNYKF